MYSIAACQRRDITYERASSGGVELRRSTLRPRFVSARHNTYLLTYLLHTITNGNIAQIGGFEPPRVEIYTVARRVANIRMRIHSTLH